MTKPPSDRSSRAPKPRVSRPRKETITITPLPEVPGLGDEDTLAQGPVKGAGAEPGAEGATRRAEPTAPAEGTDLGPVEAGAGALASEEPTTAERGALGRTRQHTDEIDTDVWDHRGRAAEEEAAEVVGRRVISERYEVLDRVGLGGMSRIYQVRHVALGKLFALKVVDHQSSEAGRIEQLFLREASVASEMDHPNIVQVTDFGTDEELGAYIVMEFLQGETLHARLRKLGAQRQRMHEAAALDIGLQTAEALHYMHGKGVIHCDIKSENIFLCSQQKEHRQRTVVKLIDFGLSRRKASGLRLAQAEVAGTPEYMAPELLQGRSPQPSMDVYSVGVLFYEMLTGRLPFFGSMRSVIKAQVFQEPRPPSTLLPEPPDERLEAFIMKCLSKEPRRRPDSMGQVIFELRTLLEMRNLRGGHKGRSVVTRAPEPESTAFRRFFDRCPCPLFQLDAQAQLVQANRAFRQFVGLGKADAIGRPVDRTRLAYVYPAITTDVLAAVKRGRRTPLQRVLSFEQSAGKRVSMMCWLTPEPDDQGQVVRFDGCIHPLQK